MPEKPSKKRPLVRARPESELDKRIQEIGSALPTTLETNQLLPDVSKLKIRTPDIDKALAQLTEVKPLAQSLQRIDGGIARAMTDTAAARLSVNQARTIGGLEQLGFANPLAGISERLAQINQAILGPSQQIQKMVDQWANIWKGWKPQVEAVFKAMEEMIEAQRELDERTDAFVKNHSWPLPLRLFGRQCSKIVAMAEEPKRKVNATMQATFKPGTKAHRATKELLFESPAFASRKPLLQQAYKAHKSKYSLRAFCAVP